MNTTHSNVANVETWHATSKVYVSDIAYRVRKRIAKDKRLTENQLADIFSFDTVDLRKALGEALDYLKDVGVIKKSKGSEQYMYNL